MRFGILILCTVIVIGIVFVYYQKSFGIAQYITATTTESKTTTSISTSFTTIIKTETKQETITSKQSISMTSISTCTTTKLLPGYNIRDPSYEEMAFFIGTDKTNENIYSENYTCLNFCNDVKQNAFDQGIKCGFVYIEFSDGAHSIVCFKTTDRGTIYIEPQSDQITTVAVGQVFQTIGYEPMGTVKYFTVIW